MRGAAAGAHVEPLRCHHPAIALVEEGGGEAGKLEEEDGGGRKERGGKAGKLEVEGDGGSADEGTARSGDRVPPPG
ncbi:hypothetical protein E2562_037039 [Oryza meyeriana var. granulata]|uniref:DUF834 domain-containing protein n=1 Tax=Oryza meyeriana var. granulata TaxID=110450 RepID=A0A6G1DSJ0_9ORYZ|nr:hypothetical protein E2562_037039 [Oryza meyeriana var. granulata]